MCKLKLYITKWLGTYCRLRSSIKAIAYINKVCVDKTLEAQIRFETITPKHSHGKRCKYFVILHRMRNKWIIKVSHTKQSKMIHSFKLNEYIDRFLSSIYWIIGCNRLIVLNYFKIKYTNKPKIYSVQA